MSRIASAFADGPAFVPYLVVGDPSPAVSVRYVEALAAGGADMIELGLPFSEPIAEGETIQRGIERALTAGITPAAYLDLVEGLDVDVPLVCMTYYNLLLRFGEGVDPAPFVERAASAGIDGFIVPDLPVEEADALLGACEAYDRDLIFIVAPTTTEARLARIRERASGCIYVQSRMGTTGARAALSARTHRALSAVADWSIPKLVGFGISQPAHVSRVLEAGADGAVVGSALVDVVAEGHREGASTDAVAERLERRVQAYVEAAEATGAIDPRVRSVLARARRGRDGPTPIAVEARSLPAAFERAVADGRVPVIGELKFASPTSAGEPEGDPVAIARTMVEAGVAAISVLTEPTRFAGSVETLAAVRRAVDVPVLRKDFLLRESHLDLVAADVVLLIARFVDDLPGMVEAARERGMAPLVEVHTRAELVAAEAAGATLVGINNRDLATLSVDLTTFERVAPAASAETTLVAESGLADCTDVRRMLDHGAEGVLIGSAIMAGPVGETAATFVGCGSPASASTSREAQPVE